MQKYYLKMANTFRDLYPAVIIRNFKPDFQTFNHICFDICPGYISRYIVRGFSGSPYGYLQICFDNIEAMREFCREMHDKFSSKIICGNFYASQDRFMPFDVSQTYNSYFDFDKQRSESERFFFQRQNEGINVRRTSSENVEIGGEYASRKHDMETTKNNKISEQTSKSIADKRFESKKHCGEITKAVALASKKYCGEIPKVVSDGGLISKEDGEENMNLESKKDEKEINNPEGLPSNRDDEAFSTCRNFLRSRMELESKKDDKEKIVLDDYEGLEYKNGVEEIKDGENSKEEEIIQAEIEHLRALKEDQGESIEPKLERILKFKNESGVSSEETVWKNHEVSINLANNLTVVLKEDSLISRDIGFVKKENRPQYAGNSDKQLDMSPDVLQNSQREIKRELGGKQISKGPVFRAMTKRQTEELFIPRREKEYITKMFERTKDKKGENSNVVNLETMDSISQLSDYGINEENHISLEIKKPEADSTICTTPPPQTEHDIDVSSDDDTVPQIIETRFTNLGDLKSQLDHQKIEISTEIFLPTLYSKPEEVLKIADVIKIDSDVNSMEVDIFGLDGLEIVTIDQIDGYSDDGTKQKITDFVGQENKLTIKMEKVVSGNKNCYKIRKVFVHEKDCFDDDKKVRFHLPEQSQTEDTGLDDILAEDEINEIPTTYSTSYSDIVCLSDESVAKTEPKIFENKDLEKELEEYIKNGNLYEVSQQEARSMAQIWRNNGAFLEDSLYYYWCEVLHSGKLPQKHIPSWKTIRKEFKSYFDNKAAKIKKVRKEPCFELTARFIHKKLIKAWVDGRVTKRIPRFQVASEDRSASSSSTHSVAEQFEEENSEQNQEAVVSKVQKNKSFEANRSNSSSPNSLDQELSKIKVEFYTFLKSETQLSISEFQHICETKTIDLKFLNAWFDVSNMDFQQFDSLIQRQEMLNNTDNRNREKYTQALFDFFKDRGRKRKSPEATNNGYKKPPGIPSNLFGQLPDEKTISLLLEKSSISSDAAVELAENMVGRNEQFPLGIELMAESDDEAGQTLKDIYELLKSNKILMEKYSKLTKEQENYEVMVNLEEQIKELEKLPQYQSISIEKNLCIDDQKSFDDWKQTIIKRIENLEKENLNPTANNTAPTRTIVRLTSETNNEEILVHTDSEGRIPEERVKALFCDITAIKFKPNVDSSIWRMLLHEDGWFHPPDDGWKERLYLCIKPKRFTKENERKDDLGKDTEIIQELIYANTTGQQIENFQQWIPSLDSPEVRVSMQNYNLQLQQQMYNIWPPGSIQANATNLPRENLQQILGNPLFSFTS